MQIARDVFGVEPDYLDPMTVLDRIREANMCSNLGSSVDVWIDNEGWHRVPVHEKHSA
ncbi:MAG: hypothetical protein O2856_15970 [Planctomycetota bacterium]|nr:hypothetical protein [Planctomycetota bacterium]